MAGGQVVEQQKHGKGKKGMRRRLGVRIDMTPLVDVAFLLLTFFMLTTTMSHPQTMEINLPLNPRDVVEVPERNLLTLRVDDKDQIYWAIGKDAPEKIEFERLRSFLLGQNRANSKLATLVKVDRKGKYEMMVDIMDELNVANVSRFSIAPLLEADKAVLAKVKG